MAQHYQLCMIVLIVVFLPKSSCLAQFIPGPDTSDIFVIEGLGDGAIPGAGAGTGIVGDTGAGFSALSAFSALVPLLILVPLLLAATVLAPVPAPTTPCVPENCPAGFRLLPNQAISTNCYSYSGSAASNNRAWSLALAQCIMTPGAYLWRPNSELEASSVRNEFNFPNNQFVWTGANDIDMDGIFTFEIENGPFAINAVPFGIGIADPAINTDCVGILFDGTRWFWSERLCSEIRRFICEYPRRVCT